MLEAKAKKMMTVKPKNDTKRELSREMMMHKRKYWELMFKIQIKIQFLRQLSVIIQRKKAEDRGLHTDRNAKIPAMVGYDPSFDYDRLNSAG
jgi:hypothetical protein